jgi:hypothetical protein
MHDRPQHDAAFVRVGVGGAAVHGRDFVTTWPKPAWR